MISSDKKRLIRGAVLKTFIDSKTDKLPIDIISIIRSFKNCRLIPYSRHMKKFNLSYDEMIELSETDDAYTVYSAKRNQYLIFYNDIDLKMITSNRYRWSLAHELGHVMLNHHKLSDKTKIFRNSLSNFEYKIFEDEVDWYAAYILAPHIPMYFKGVDNAHDLKKICQLSDLAASNRYKDYKLWKRNNNINNLGRYDLWIKKLFYNYIFEYNCKNCKAKFFHEISNFCPICGSENITKRSIRNNMIYKGIEVDEDSKAVRCPICDNEEVDEGEHCKICGTYIVNKCTNKEHVEIDAFGDETFVRSCEKPLEGNARFCPHCGSRSTFYRDKLLKSWQESIHDDSEEYKPMFQPVNSSFFAPIEDDDIPF